MLVAVIIFGVDVKPSSVLPSPLFLKTRSSRSVQRTCVGRSSVPLARDFEFGTNTRETKACLSFGVGFKVSSSVVPQLLRGTQYSQLVDDSLDTRRLQILATPPGLPFAHIRPHAAKHCANIDSHRDKGPRSNRTACQATRDLGSEPEVGRG